MIKIDVPEIIPGGDEKIPRLIHYCWFGKEPFPPLITTCLDSWKKFLPDYKIIRWDEETFDIASQPYTREAYQTKKWPFVTRYIRLYALYHFGGIYMDTDIEIIKPLDRFLKDPAFTCFEPVSCLSDPVIIQTGMIGSGKGNIWIKKLLDHYESNKFFDENGVPDLTANTITLTNITIKEFGLKPVPVLQSLGESVVVYPHDYFCPMHWKERRINKTENTHAVHHFLGSWLPEKHDNYTTRLETTIIEKADLIRRLENVIKEKDAALESATAALDGIYGSNGWRLLLKYYKVRDKIRERLGRPG